MHLVMLDTCIWLDISSKKAELPMLTALEHLVEGKVIGILLPDLVRTEYERNKDSLNSTHKCNAHPCINFVRRLPAQAFSRA